MGKRPDKTTACSIEGCSRDVLARGWCMGHYSRWRDHRDPLAGQPLAPVKLCSIKGCAKALYGRGWCQMHYRRWVDHGDVEYTDPIRDTYRPAPLERLFWAKVDKGDGSGCWLWTGTKSRHGYGQLIVKRNGTRKHLVASRLSWTLNVGPIPDGLWVLHRCDNPPCCNPAHLFLGTQSDNMRDMVAKGRGRQPSHT